MPIDIPNLLLGLCLAATPLLAVLWQWQRRLQLLQQERLLLDERLSTSQLALDGFSVQLEDSRAEAAHLRHSHAQGQAQLAALTREAQLLRQECATSREAAQQWAHSREQKDAELRRLDAERAGLAAELREQQDSHQQRLADLQGSAMNCARSLPSWPGRSSMSASSALPTAASSAWGNCLTH